MKRKIFAGLSAFALVAGFWACGDGSVEALNDDDLTVKGFLEDSDVDTTAKSGFFKPEDVETAKADCLLNEKCKAAMDKAAGDSVVPTSEAVIPTAYSSSSPANPGSSSAKGPIVNYSSASVTPVAGSSSSATSSGQTTVSSSSETAIADWTNPDASCKVKTSSAIQKGGTGEWTIDMVGACPDYLTDKAGNKACKEAFASADCEMTLTGSNEKSTTVKCNQSTVSATYAGIGSYGAKIKVGDHVHDCTGKVEVQGTPVTSCECTVDNTKPDVKDGDVTVTWTVSGCMAGTAAAEIGTYAWTGPTGTSATAKATVSAKGDTQTASVKVTSTENASMSVTCPTVKAINSDIPDYLLTKVVGNNAQMYVDVSQPNNVKCEEDYCVKVPNGQTVVLSGDAASATSLRCIHGWQQEACSVTLTSGSESMSYGKADTSGIYWQDNCGLYWPDPFAVSSLTDHAFSVELTNATEVYCFVQ